MHLRLNDIGAEGCAHLATALQSEHCKVHTLDLYWNDIDADGCAHLVTAQKAPSQPRGGGGGVRTWWCVILPPTRYFSYFYLDTVHQRCVCGFGDGTPAPEAVRSGGGKLGRELEEFIAVTVFHRGRGRFEHTVL